MFCIRTCPISSMIFKPLRSCIYSVENMNLFTHLSEFHLTLLSGLSRRTILGRNQRLPFGLLVGRPSQRRTIATAVDPCCRRSFILRSSSMEHIPTSDSDPFRTNFPALRTSSTFSGLLLSESYTASLSETWSV